MCRTRQDGTVSVIDTTVCNQDQLSGCNQTWPTINLGGSTRFDEINNATHTLYVANLNDGAKHGWVSVINAATCNGQNRLRIALQLAQIRRLGIFPEQMAIDPVTNTIYVENQAKQQRVDHQRPALQRERLSVPAIKPGRRRRRCRARKGSDSIRPRRTIYVANRNDDTVSVISTVHCTGSDTSGCRPAATVPVGAGPRSVGIVAATNTVFIGNRNDLTVSLFNGSTCNGSEHDPVVRQTPPPAVLVGAFPDTGGNGNNINGRTIAIDQQKQLIFVPIAGDSDVAVLDGHSCRAGHADACHVKIAKKRAGGFPVTAAVDESTATVYVVNDDDGTVSVFPSSR